MLRARGICKRHGPEKALKGVDLDVDQGQIVAGCVVALILLATATFRTVNQLNGLQNVGAMVFGGLGGALLAASAVLALLGAIRFRADETKEFFA